MAPRKSAATKGLEKSVAEFNAMAMQVLQNLEAEPLPDRDKYLSDYSGLLESVAEAAVKKKMPDLASVCETVGGQISSYGAGTVEFDENELMNLSQFPMMLQDMVENDAYDAAMIGEFIDAVGWGANGGGALIDSELTSDPGAGANGAIDEAGLFDDLAGLDQELGAVEEPVPDDLPDDGAVSDEPSGSGIELDRMQQEVVDLLRAELAEIIAGQKEYLTLLCGDDAAARQERQEQQADQLERIVSACDMVGLNGISFVVSQIASNVADMDVTTQALDENYHGLVIDWPIYVLRYFQESFSERSIALLMQLLKRPEWPFPLGDDEEIEISTLLNNADIQIDEGDTTPRQTEARIEDLSLEIPADVNKELLDSLLDELPEHTAEFSASVQSMIANHFVSDIELARRIAHTVKGSCNIVGIAGLANMTHQLEDILDEMALHNVVPTGKLANTFLDAADCMEGMVEAVLGLGEPPPEALKVQQDILDWANHIDQNGVAEISAPAAAPGASAAMKQVSDEPQAETGEPQSAESQPLTAAQPVQVAEQSPESPTEAATDAVLRIRSSLVDELLRLAGENIISTGQIRSHLGTVVESMLKLDSQNQYLSSLVAELEQLVDVRGVASRHQSSTDSEFDALEMEQYNELHTSTHRLIEAVVDNIEFTSTVSKNLKLLEDVAEVQEKLVRDNQESVLKTRMVPVSTSIPRLQRCVRQAVRSTNREVRLEVKGSETLMDSNVLSDLMEPLMHMLRNSVDHGIEDEQERIDAGKAVEGVIHLIFGREGDHINVKVEDDGRGLDRDAILAKANDRGILVGGHVPTEDDIYNLILTPGFSTKKEVTQLSGRGVGMDVVSEKVRSIKGTLIINSQPGQGTSMSITLPVTLLSTHAMIIPVNDQIFAVSNFGVEEIIYANPGDIDYLGEKLVFKTSTETLGAHFLNEKLGSAAIDSAINDAHVGLSVRRTDGSKSVMLVENVIDSRDLVVKPLLQQIPKVAGVVGATILGDGSVAPVLDLTELLLTKASMGTMRSTTNEVIDRRTSSLPDALVVDDSYSARSNLEQFVSDLGFQVRAAKDGMEAVEMIAEKVPDILLTDLEMPRMNGLDLATHVRANDETRHMPIILITSRSTQKHRDLAEAAGVNEYLTKPYSEDELMQHIDDLLKG